MGISFSLSAAGFEFINFIISLIIGGPFALGLVFFSLSILRNKNPKFEQLFSGFNYFSKAFVANLLVMIFTFLWMLLLIIPGIIKSLAYSMTFYIIADNKNIEPSEAIDKSINLMDGHKWELFGLWLWFCLLGILCIFTIGIGFLWLAPYVGVRLANFYENIKSSRRG
jgi:uncharacterized membrane protein